MHYIFLLIISNFVFAQEMITPIPLNIDVNLPKAFLGKKLFNDNQLSHNNTISCANCHILTEGGDDNIPLSIGMEGKLLTRNAPTIFNSRFNSTQFWDARVQSLEEQVISSINHPHEMATTFKDIIYKLSKSTTYRNKFNAIYKNGINKENITNAISEYEKTLITPNSKFDKFLRGDTNVLSPKEKEGYLLFKQYGCIACHNGINIGGNLIQKIGINEKFSTDDLGRYNITKKTSDKFYFRVPSLRNVELTSPYLHDGSVGTLKEAIKVMAHYQIGYKLEEKNILKIELFLKTLTGELNNIEEIHEQKNF